jgi:Fur family transcriptional regulator, zinc uptake regulator
VLEILWQSHRPLGAYAVLEILSRDGRAAAPPTVYRALEFLLDQGLVHRIASLNAFVGCVRPGHPAAGQFLICEVCGSAAEVNDPRLMEALERTADAEGFAPAHPTIEVKGRCPACQ